MSDFSRAAWLAKHNFYEEAAQLYHALAGQYPGLAAVAGAGAEKCRSIAQGAPCRSPEATGTGAALTRHFGIEKFYLENVREEAVLQALRELTNQGIAADIMSCDDEQGAEQFFHDFLRSNIYMSGLSNAHVSVGVKEYWKESLSKADFARLLIYEKIFQDALANNYSRIMVLTSGAFAVNGCAAELAEIAAESTADFLVLNLGCIDIYHRNDTAFGKYAIAGKKHLYRPIPGFTCGAFAVIYDCRIFAELLPLIAEHTGPYDSCALGAIYLRRMKQCYAAIRSPFCFDIINCNTFICNTQPDVKGYDYNMYEAANRYASPFRVLVLHSGWASRPDFPGLAVEGATFICEQIETRADTTPSVLLQSYASAGRDCDMVIYSAAETAPDDAEMSEFLVAAMTAFNRSPQRIFTAGDMYASYALARLRARQCRV